MTDKEKQYELVLAQVKSLLADEKDVVASLANVAAVVHQAFGFWWTGFYRVQGQELVLGPFQGPVACTRIGFGKGVCGTAWQRAETIIVPDVHQFPGHIACSAASNSEIVVPVKDQQGKVVMVLDIDSTAYNCFDETDGRYLEQVVAEIARILPS